MRKTVMIAVAAASLASASVTAPRSAQAGCGDCWYDAGFTAAAFLATVLAGDFGYGYGYPNYSYPTKVSGYGVPSYGWGYGYPASAVYVPYAYYGYGGYYRPRAYGTYGARYAPRDWGPNYYGPRRFGRVGYGYGYGRAYGYGW